MKINKIRPILLILILEVIAGLVFAKLSHIFSTNGCAGYCTSVGNPLFQSVCNCPTEPIPPIQYIVLFWATTIAFLITAIFAIMKLFRNN
jgi:hypothetical protein